jgi:hypothetical protein
MRKKPIVMIAYCHHHQATHEHKIKTVAELKTNLAVLGMLNANIPYQNCRSLQRQTILTQRSFQQERKKDGKASQKASFKSSDGRDGLPRVKLTTTKWTLQRMKMASFWRMQRIGA